MSTNALSTLEARASAGMDGIDHQSRNIQSPASEELMLVQKRHNSSVSATELLLYAQTHRDNSNYNTMILQFRSYQWSKLWGLSEENFFNGDTPITRTSCGSCYIETGPRLHKIMIVPHPRRLPEMIMRSMASTRVNHTAKSLLFAHKRLIVMYYTPWGMLR